MPIERLSPLDAVFVAAESPVSHMHVLGVMVLDSRGAPAGLDVDVLRRVFASRLEGMPVLRRRLVRVPYGLESPRWIDVAEVDLARHVRAASVARPGGLAELATLVAGVAERKLDLNRPPWEVWLVDGLAGGRQAMVAKVHHSLLDGVATLGLVASLFDLEPLPPPAELASTAVPGAPDREPADGELFVESLTNLWQLPLRAAGSVATLASSVRRMRRRRGEEGPAASVFSGPRLPWNGSIGARRRVAFTDVPMPEVDKVRSTIGATVNDIVLAVMSGALRRYLAGRGELPDRMLVAAVPTSIREAGDPVLGGNRVSVMLAGLPAHLDDAGARLAATREHAVSAKSAFEALGTETVPEAAGMLPHGLISGLMSFASLAGVFGRMPPLVNMIVSNVPGPPIPLYLAGARVDAAYAHGPVLDGIGLNLTVISYIDRIGFAFLADRELVPDLDDLAAEVPRALDDLVAAVC